MYISGAKGYVNVFIRCVFGVLLSHRPYSTKGKEAL